MQPLQDPDLAMVELFSEALLDESPVLISLEWRHVSR